MLLQTFLEEFLPDLRVPLKLNHRHLARYIFELSELLYSFRLVEDLIVFQKHLVHLHFLVFFDDLVA